MKLIDATIIFTFKAIILHMDIDQLVSLPDAARMVGINPPLFRYYIKKGKTPQTVPFAGRQYFVRTEIEGWTKPIPEKVGPKYKTPN